jgi:hypothetical protein
MRNTQANIFASFNGLHDDAAYSIVTDLISEMGADPDVLAIFADTANILGMSILPNKGLQIQNEPNSIINHYSTLRSPRPISNEI